MEAALLPELYDSDIAKTKSFYMNTLGFSMMYERPENKFLRVERQGSEFMFVEYNPENKTQWILVPLEYPYGRGISFQMDTANVDELYQKVQASGATIYLPMEEEWYRADDVYLGCRQFIVQDPDGYLLRFAEDLGTRDHAPS